MHLPDLYKGNRGEQRQDNLIMIEETCLVSMGQPTAVIDH